MARVGIAPLPQHVAIIMDGNGRWAESRGLPRLAGHYAGTENVHSVAVDCAEYGIEYLTLFAFSTENWRRSQEEVEGLIRIFGEFIDKETKFYYENGVRLWHLGQLEGLPQLLVDKIQRAVELTKDNKKLMLSLAFNYGGRAEIVDAVRRLIKDGISPQEVDEALFHNYLYISGLPDPDLLIRTGGEMRLSNFLLWQSAYAEFYSTPTLWPDFDSGEMEKALIAYSQRERRFGGVKARGGREG
jgi:undecaprenyl diphosphate synthase